MGELDRYKSGPTWTVKNRWLDKFVKTKNIARLPTLKKLVKTGRPLLLLEAYAIKVK